MQGSLPEKRMYPVNEYQGSLPSFSRVTRHLKGRYRFADICLYSHCIPSLEHMDENLLAIPCISD